ncbi:MAG TPA: hypothetical protein ENI65_00660 [Gammaproteobacteria bacterium]|nr:hypothetical protein [Gammaproteobacteria bacterium]
MVLDVYVDNQAIKVEIPENMFTHAYGFFENMDADMDKGWKMGPSYIENPDAMMRAQIAADKMLTAIDAKNDILTQLMAAYIVMKIPEVKSVNIDIHGEPLNTEITV